MTRVLVGVERPDPPLRHLALLLVLVAAAVLFVRWQRDPAQPAARAPLAADPAAGRQAAARLQHRALHAHLKHPHRQRRAGARRAADLRARSSPTCRCAMRSRRPPRACARGRPSAAALAASRLFPPMTIHLISSGESSGKLESMLERAALSQEQELEGLVTALTGPAGAAADRLHGAVRHGHRICDAIADLRR